MPVAEVTIEAQMVCDATELGDLLPLAGVEYLSGAEARSETGEPHAAERADAENVQSFTCCFAVDYRSGEEHVIEKPRDYERFRDEHPISWTYPNPITLQPVTRTLFTEPGGQFGQGAPGMSGIPTKLGTAAPGCGAGGARGVGAGSGVGGAPGSAGPGGMGDLSSDLARTMRWPAAAGRGAPRATAGGPSVTAGAPACCQRTSWAKPGHAVRPRASPMLPARMRLMTPSLQGHGPRIRSARGRRAV